MLLAVLKVLPESHGQPSSSFSVGELVRDSDFRSFHDGRGSPQGAMFAYIAGSPFVLIELHHVPAEQYGYFFDRTRLG
ncbi:MAG: hypothetical protein U0165_03225 [Polyangiaceae bacterium]